MKTLYQRQFTLMAGVLLVAFLLLGGAFAALSYQYIIQDKRESIEHNASYMASFTSAYLTQGYSSSIQDAGYQLYISSLSDISDSTVILAENNGTIEIGRAHV